MEEMKELNDNEIVVVMEQCKGRDRLICVCANETIAYIEIASLNKAHPSSDGL